MCRSYFRVLQVGEQSLHVRHHVGFCVPRRQVGVAQAQLGCCLLVALEVQLGDANEASHALDLAELVVMRACGLHYETIAYVLGMELICAATGLQRACRTRASLGACASYMCQT